MTADHGYLSQILILYNRFLRLWLYFCKYLGFWNCTWFWNHSQLYDTYYVPCIRYELVAIESIFWSRIGVLCIWIFTFENLLNFKTAHALELWWRPPLKRIWRWQVKQTNNRHTKIWSLEFWGGERETCSAMFLWKSISASKIILYLFWGLILFNEKLPQFYWCKKHNVREYFMKSSIPLHFTFYLNVFLYQLLLHKFFSHYVVLLHNCHYLLTKNNLFLVLIRILGSVLVLLGNQWLHF